MSFGKDLQDQIKQMMHQMMKESRPGYKSNFPQKKSNNEKLRSNEDILSTAERRGTPVLLSASVSDNSGNSPQMAAPSAMGGRVKETNQCSAFMFVVIIDVYLATNLVDYMDVNF